MTSENLNRSTIFVVSHFLSAKVSPEWRLNQGLGTQPSKSVPSTEVPSTKVISTFLRDKFCVLEGRCPKGEITQYILTGLQRLMACILPTMHCRSQTCWELLHPFAHHCQHARNNFQHCWRNNVGSCCARLHAA